VVGVRKSERVDHRDVFCDIEMDRDNEEERGDICVDPDDELQLSLSTLKNISRDNKN
jgi:hypothetical protein